LQILVCTQYFHTQVDIVEKGLPVKQIFGISYHRCAGISLCFSIQLFRGFWLWGHTLSCRNDSLYHDINTYTLYCLFGSVLHPLMLKPL